MLKRKDIKELTTEEILVNIFYYGISACNEGATKQEDKELLWHCDELAKRGIINDPKALYQKMCK